MHRRFRAERNRLHDVAYLGVEFGVEEIVVRGGYAERCLAEKCVCRRTLGRITEEID